MNRTVPMKEETEMEFDRIDTKPRNILAKRGITSGTRLMHVFPRRFYDLTYPLRWGITPEMKRWPALPDA